MPKSIYRPEYGQMRKLLRDVRERKGITQVDLAQRLGNTQNFISAIERGSRRIDAVELRDFCRQMETDLASFVEEWEQRIASAKPTRGAKNPSGMPGRRRKASRA
jgi:transcriptional regulator with XRE-family HTH domain